MADLRELHEAAWIKADREFQRHRGGCSTCAWNPRRRSFGELCDEGRKLFESAEALLRKVDQ